MAVTGVLAVVGGVLLISLAGLRSTRSRSAERSGVGWGLATGVTIAAYTLWDNHSVNALDVPPLPYFVLGLLLQLPFLAVLLRRRREPTPVRQLWSTARTPALVVAVFSPLAYLLVLRAMQLAPVALVAAARESSIVVGARVRLARAAGATTGQTAGRRGRGAGRDRPDRRRLISKPGI